MRSLARTERARLCDLALALGPDAATLCDGWTVRDLLAHLLVREGNPAAVGIAVRPLRPLTEAATRRLASRDFEALVLRLRAGPPWYSPMRVGPVDGLTNTLEFLVHHEDVRRAQPSWRPRLLPPAAQDAVWRALGLSGRGLVRAAPAGVVLARSDAEETKALRGGAPTVVVRGLPSELALFAYGRQRVADVELEGPPGAAAALTGADLGV